MDKAKLMQELEEERELLKECDEFITNFDYLKEKSEEDVLEAKIELDESKAKVTEAKRELTSTMENARRKRYSEEQKINLYNVQVSIVERAINDVQVCEDCLKKYIELQRKLTPDLLAEAKSDRAIIYARVKYLESQLGGSYSKDTNESNSWGKDQWVGLVVLIVIIIFVLKACGI